MDLAIKDISRHLGKFIATILGVGLLLTIVFIMNGIYRGIIADGIWLIENTDTDLWVVERGRGGPFNEQSRVRMDMYKSVQATPGVMQAGPFIVYAVQREIAGRSQQFSIVGYDIAIGLGKPGRIIEGRQITAFHYEMVADKKLGLQLGDTVRLGVHDYRVVGITKGAVDSGGNPLIYLALPDAQEVLYQMDNQAIYASRAASLQRLLNAGLSQADAERMLPLVSAPVDTISAVLVRLRPGEDAQLVKDHIAKWLYLSVFSSDDEKNLMLEGRVKRISIVLGTFRVLLLVVSIVIVALIVYVLTIEKIKSIATLKLIGASNWVIVRLILEQTLMLTISSFLFGYTMAALVKASERFPRTLYFLTFDTITIFLIMLVGGILASGLAVWHALKAPPALALGG